MTKAEQASLDSLAERVDGRFSDIETKIDDSMTEIRRLMEDRRKVEDQVKSDLDQRIQVVESRGSVQDAFFSFGKYALTTVLAATVVIHYL